MSAARHVMFIVLAVSLKLKPRDESIAFTPADPNVDLLNQEVSRQTLLFVCSHQRREIRLEQTISNL